MPPECQPPKFSRLYDRKLFSLYWLSDNSGSLPLIENMGNKTHIKTVILHSQFSQIKGNGKTKPFSHPPGKFSFQGTRERDFVPSISYT